eukprot:Skav232658  [mRNA]  locus=scaffold698:64426:66983:+ [translate_table: standard]
MSPSGCEVHRTAVWSLLSGLLAAEGQIYYPHDFRVGQSIDVWGRKLVIYDCYSMEEGTPRNGEPEDEFRRLVIAYYLADDEEVLGHCLLRGLKDLATTMGIHLVDHEVVTLLRHFGVAGGGGQPPRIVGPLALRAAQ